MTADDLIPVTHPSESTGMLHSADETQEGRAHANGVPSKTVI